MRRSKPRPKKAAAAPAPVDDGTRMIGYMRVSTDDQNFDLQEAALLKAGVLPDNLRRDRASGVKANRPGLRHALLDATRGDTFVVWKLDRLGRSMSDLLKRVQWFKDEGVRFISLTEAIDTSTASGSFLLNVMGSVAEFERELVRERTKAGMHESIKRGQKMGAPKKVTPEVIARAKELIRQNPAGGYAYAAKKLGVGRSTLTLLIPGGVGAVLAEGKSNRKMGRRKK